MGAKVVLDASAVLAFLQGEQGCDVVGDILMEGKAIISAVNYAEVVGKLLEKGLPESSVQVVMDNLELQIAPLDDKQAWQTGLLRMNTKAFGLSLGDRACLALARDLNLSVMTADKQLHKIIYTLKQVFLLFSFVNSLSTGQNALNFSKA